jgi:taurine dioxygenase
MPALLSYKPLDGPFGVEVEVDLAKSMSPEQRAELLRLFNLHGMVIFRGQKLSYQEQIRSLSYLKRGGYIERDPKLVSNVGAAGFVGSEPLDFHSDAAYLRYPTRAASLYAIDVVDGASGTKFSSGKLAYRSLSADLRARVDRLHTIHVMPRDMYARNRVKRLPPYYPKAARLLAPRHDVTGDRVIYISWDRQIDCIAELPVEESDALLDELHAYVSAPANIYDHRWRNDDLVMWDNIAVLHAREDTSKVGTRVLRRCSVRDVWTWPFRLQAKFSRPMMRWVEPASRTGRRSVRPT